MIGIDVEEIARGLENIESVALLPVVPSTNALGRRVIAECLENELDLPSAVLLALEQTAGQGRAARSWYSPSGRGIWATILHTRSQEQLSLIPLEVACAITSFLRERWHVEAGIKWPNDVLVEGRKIAGVLIEARSRDHQALLAIGIGLNVLPLGKDAPPETTSIAEATSSIVDLPHAIEGFLQVMDEALFRRESAGAVVDRWRELTIHREGDRVAFMLQNERVEGTWMGIDQTGQAKLRLDDGTERLVSAGDIVVLTQDA